MIEQGITGKLREDLFRKRLIMISGPRFSGKSGLIRDIFKGQTDSCYWMDGDRLSDRELFSRADTNWFAREIGNRNYLVMEEFQRFEDPWLTIKDLVDKAPSLNVLLSSSSLSALPPAKSAAPEPYFSIYTLLPVSFHEMTAFHGSWKEVSQLNHRLVWGAYPDIIVNPGDETEQLTRILDDSLCKDVISRDKIKKSGILSGLLTILARNIGKIISYNELGKEIGVDKETVERYIEALEQSYLIFRLNSFSGKSKLELKKSRKIYFVDNGIRNAILNDFTSFDQRADAAALWENYLVSERIKVNMIYNRKLSTFFWRTALQHELTYLEEENNHVSGFSIDRSPESYDRDSRSFSKLYPNIEINRITHSNFDEFISFGIKAYQNENNGNIMRIDTKKNRIQDEWEID